MCVNGELVKSFIQHSYSEYFATIKNNEHTKLDFFFFFWSYHTVSKILVSHLGTEPGPLPVKAQSLNHWIAREFSKLDTFEE